MPPRRWYDLMYVFAPPWEPGIRDELRTLVRSGRLTPETLPPGRAVDLGSGIGANSIFLADEGFEVTGIDFSKVAVRRAELAAKGKPARRIRFVRGDVTADSIPGVTVQFDLAIDTGTLGRLRGRHRDRMAATVKRLVRPGGVFVLWCRYGDAIGQPNPSRGLIVGEERKLFADTFDIERLPEPPPGSGGGVFLMTRR